MTQVWFYAGMIMIISMFKFQDDFQFWLASRFALRLQKLRANGSNLSVFQ